MSRTRKPEYPFATHPHPRPRGRGDDTHIECAISQRQVQTSETPSAARVLHERALTRPSYAHQRTGAAHKGRALPLVHTILNPTHPNAMLSANGQQALRLRTWYAIPPPSVRRRLASMHKVRRASSDMARDPQYAHQRPGAAHTGTRTPCVHTILNLTRPSAMLAANKHCDCEPGTPFHPRPSVGSSPACTKFDIPAPTWRAPLTCTPTTGAARKGRTYHSFTLYQTPPAQMPSYLPTSIGNADLVQHSTPVRQ